jgi:large subunit ribosomal protein L5
MENTKTKLSNVFKALKADFSYKNVMQAPRLTKVVVSSGTGAKIKVDKNKNDFIADRLAKITGQKPSARQAKKSIASFKLREGEVIGQTVTLRGERMNSFVDKLIHIAFPRTKDFRGLDSKALDDIGNLTLGIKEHTIFPETGDEELKDVFGLSITFVTTAKSKKEAKAFFDYLGIPFKK